MDNSRSPGDDRRRSPSGAPGRPPVEPRPGRVVPTPGDGAGGDGAGGERTGGGRRGADLAREALRAAREAATERSGRRPTARSGRPLAPRGRRRRWSGPGPDDRDPQPLGRLVARVSVDRGWSPRLTDATVLARWPHLVGREVADHCTPVSLRDGELVVAAESTAWATQLRTLQRQLLARLAAAVGTDVVRRIRVVGPAGPSWRRGPRTVRGRGPRDTYG